MNDPRRDVGADAAIEARLPLAPALPRTVAAAGKDVRIVPDPRLRADDRERQLGQDERAAASPSRAVRPGCATRRHRCPPSAWLPTLRRRCAVRRHRRTIRAERAAVLGRLPDRRSSSSENPRPRLRLRALSQHAFDERHGVVIMARRIPIHDRADGRQNIVGLPRAVLVLDVVEQAATSLRLMLTNSRSCHAGRIWARKSHSIFPRDRNPLGSTYRLHPIICDGGEALAPCLDRRQACPHAAEDLPRPLACLLDGEPIDEPIVVHTCLPSGSRVTATKIFAPLGWTRIQWPRSSGSATARRFGRGLRAATPRSERVLRMGLG